MSKIVKPNDTNFPSQLVETNINSLLANNGLRLSGGVRVSPVIVDEIFKDYHVRLKKKK